MELAIDYGVRPRVFLPGDTKFLEPFHRAFGGVAYMTAPRWGQVLSNVPMLVLLFQSSVAARDAFQFLRAWNPDEYYAEGVRLTFIEQGDHTFRLCVTQDFSSLVRGVPEHLRDEVELVGSAAVYCKDFGRMSDAYKAFKKVAFDGPVVVAPGAQSGPDIESGLLVRRLYYEEASERDLAAVAAGAQVGERPSASRAEVLRRRTRQLRRFFPVTLYELLADARYQECRAALIAEGYAAWQVDQAACTYNLFRRSPGLASVEKLTIVTVLDSLTNEAEFARDERSPLVVPTGTALREQIDRDSEYLLAMLDVMPEQRDRQILQDTLRREGLLSASCEP